MSRETLHKIELKKFSKHLKRIRTTLSLTQKQLADNSGVSQSRISLLEDQKVESNPVFKTLLQISSGLQIEMSHLFDYNTKKIEKTKKRFPALEKRFVLETKSLAKRINELIKFRKIKQEELAILSKIDASEISRLLQGGENTELHNLIDLSIALEVEVKSLFDYDGPMPIGTFIAKVID